ncbi:MAG: hypothetical protein JWO31_469 [Phycisphaerales bacterium]|nr:hypothetical protein [Phycisphaerales bacterium]
MGRTKNVGHGWARAIAVPVAAVCAAGAGVAWVSSPARAADEKAPKHTIKEIMHKAHKDDDALLKKVTGPKATHDDAVALLELYKDLAANKPPKGDQADWDKRTADIVAASEATTKGDKVDAKAVATLKKTVDCKACHTLHKPA